MLLPLPPASESVRRANIKWFCLKVISRTPASPANEGQSRDRGCKEEIHYDQPPPSRRGDSEVPGVSNRAIAGDINVLAAERRFKIPRKPEGGPAHSMDAPLPGAVFGGIHLQPLSIHHNTNSAAKEAHFVRQGIQPGDAGKRAGERLGQAKRRRDSDPDSRE